MLLLSLVFATLIASPPAPTSPQPSAAATLTGRQILDKAIQVWESRPVPPFEAFTLPCHELLQKGAAGTCGSSTQMRVYLRTSDGMAHVETIPRDGGTPVVLMPEGHIYGPAYAPLGFTRRIGGSSTRVGSMAADPFAQLRTIARVTATISVYDATVVPDVCNGAPAYHLTLTPRVQEATHPLRALLVDQSSFKVCSLTYAIGFNGAEATVRYDFEDRGDPPAPFIVKITAHVPQRWLIGVHYVDSSEYLQDITFPTKVSGLP